jgi:hypothetical protein
VVSCHFLASTGWDGLQDRVPTHPSASHPPELSHIAGLCVHLGSQQVLQAVFAYIQCVAGRVHTQSAVWTAMLVQLLAACRWCGSAASHLACCCQCSLSPGIARRGVEEYVGLDRRTEQAGCGACGMCQQPASSGLLVVEKCTCQLGCAGWMVQACVCCGEVPLGQSGGAAGMQHVHSSVCGGRCQARGKPCCLSCAALHSAVFQRPGRAGACLAGVMMSAAAWHLVSPCHWVVLQRCPWRVDGRTVRRGVSLHVVCVRGVWAVCWDGFGEAWRDWGPRPVSREGVQAGRRRCSCHDAAASRCHLRVYGASWHGHGHPFRRRRQGVGVLVRSMRPLVHMPGLCAVRARPHDA